MKNTFFAQRLKEARTSQNLTQAELAKKAGVTAATVSAYESANGTKGKNPSLENAEKLANALGVSLDWLCARSVNNSNIQITDFLRMLVKLSEQSIVRVDKIDLTHREAFKAYPNIAETIDFDEYNMLRDLEKTNGVKFEYWRNVVGFGNNQIDYFLNKWAEMEKLHNNRTIDDELYNFWLEKQFLEIDKKQKQDEEFYNEMMNANTNTEDKTTQGGDTDVNNP